MNFWKLYQESQQYDKTKAFLVASLKHMEEFRQLPPTQYGTNAPKFKFTGDIVNDLRRLADVDTAYLDHLYSDMNKTGLYSGNNEVLRTLAGYFMQFQDLQSPAKRITSMMEYCESQIEKAAEALDHLGHSTLAEFYARASTVAMAAKEYAIAHLSSEANRTS